MLSPIDEKPKASFKGNVPGKVTWMSLPRKDQLFILFIGRLVDFLQVASLQAYVFYQLKSFDGSLSSTEVSRQAGLLQGCFTGAQVLTAILWGKAADASWCGRKWVLVIGLGGTAISCLGYGFATTFFWAAFWRAFGGAINGTVGIIRTMIAEITKEKKYQSRAFLLLPMSFNVAGILGPLMGGLLAEPQMTLPGIFGENAPLAFVTRSRPHDGYSQITYDWQDTSVQMSTMEPDHQKELLEKTVRVQENRVLPFARLWTRNVVFTLLTGAFYDFHLGAFTNIWSLFLSTPRYLSSEAQTSSSEKRSLPLLFTGGLGMPASTVGLATSILGVLGMVLQIFLYPPVQARLGTIRSFRWLLPLFPVAYFIAPYIAILPSGTQAPEPASGFLIWSGIIIVLLFQVTARTFTLPASIILLNNCSPHPSVLGTIHGLGQSVSAGFRTVGPVVGGWWYGFGLDIGMVAWGWWLTAAMSAVACLTALGMHEGSGHEIFLEGERDDDD
ncbi:unnamed protein product [Clonostachys rosea]|uniref:Major facilitator superfamily (MFS) profile domain-containing protein n=1 Tax=Bionectria ochroleuca TaxID=29856 RepID=A0ABY6U584_BIOOC|nr:unnamed protein product [Clonostachys rosea]